MIRVFEHKESLGHKATLSCLQKPNKELLNVLVKTLAHEKEITSKNFQTAYKAAK
jgi:hypothetical protein